MKSKNLKRHIAAALSGATISFGAVPAAQMNTDPSTYDVLGRRYFLRANLKF
jgi:hypothetical protein